MLNKFFLLVVISLILPAFKAHADSVHLSWNPPIDNVDGTTITDLAGYNVYWGTSSRTYPNMSTVLTCISCPDPIGTEREQTCLALTPGQTYYFAVTAFDASGNESDFSNEVMMDILVTGGILGNIDTTSPGSASRVDGFDLKAMMGCFGKGITGLTCTEANFTIWKNSCEKADLNYSGNVDVTDFGILSTNFGK